MDDKQFKEQVLGALQRIEIWINGKPGEKGSGLNVRVSVLEEQLAEVRDQRRWRGRAVASAALTALVTAGVALLKVFLD